MGGLDAESGDDLVFGEGIGDYGIYNLGALTSGPGKDLVQGIAGTNTSSGFPNSGGLANANVIKTGKGNYIMQGSGIGNGIANEGRLSAEQGDDFIRGEGGVFGILIGLVGFSGDFNPNFSIDGGSGNDSIVGKSVSTGIGNSGIILGSDGRDSILGEGGREVIINKGTIDGGTGDDTIKGEGKDTIRGIGTTGIIDSGLIDTGAGYDTIYGLNGGFAGPLGKTYLGAGNDRLLGFGEGKFYGGSGLDKILFGQGTYTILGSNITSVGHSMTVNEFEKIGGSKGGIFNYANGTLIVNANGVGTFAA